MRILVGWYHLDTGQLVDIPGFDHVPDPDRWVWAWADIPDPEPDRAAYQEHPEEPDPSWDEVRGWSE